MQENVHEGHRQRLKKKFIKDGFGHFEPHNILELILCYSIPRADTNVLAHKLINYFGSLSSVFEAKYEDLLKVDGVGEHSAVLIMTYLEAFRAYEEDRGSNIKIITDSESAFALLRSKFIGVTDERVAMICLDSKRKILACDIVFRGSVKSVSVSMREITEYALRHKSTAVIISHNHPSGLALPSPNDIASTQIMEKALNMIGIDLLDHIIVSDDDCVSFKDSGFLK